MYDRIREIREDKGWTQQYIAELLNINRRTYCSYENGSRTMSPEILIKLSKIHSVSIDYMLGIKDQIN